VAATRFTATEASETLVVAGSTHGRLRCAVSGDSDAWSFVPD
jgi:hypothetical protein